MEGLVGVFEFYDYLCITDIRHSAKSEHEPRRPFVVPLQQSSFIPAAQSACFILWLHPCSYLHPEGQRVRSGVRETDAFSAHQSSLYAVHPLIVSPPPGKPLWPRAYREAHIGEYRITWPRERVCRLHGPIFVPQQLCLRHIVLPRLSLPAPLSCTLTTLTSPGNS